MKKVVQTNIKTAQGAVPAKIYFEYRRNVRASIGKTGAILRIPYMIGKKEYEKHYRWFGDWVQERLGRSDHLRDHFFGREYFDGQQLTVGQRKYTLRLRREARKTGRARLIEKEIQLLLPEDGQGHAELKNIRSLISRVVASDFLPQVTRRVHELNERHFGRQVKDVRLKYTHSRWGSCSARGNINLSTRLLFAPPEVIDYVIVHELAHLIEPNHSPRFWKQVARVMPEYERHEHWLKENQHLCDF